MQTLKQKAQKEKDPADEENVFQPPIALPLPQPAVASVPEIQAHKISNALALAAVMPQVS